ncbi:MAG: amino acid ABC transporter substrate-binding protein [Desulfitobacterium sp.]|nr:amino acid ABC transporter substrate-binding protein [Desulfitobacterium sp.]
MKKFLATGLAVVLSGLLLVGCGSSGTAGEQNDPGTEPTNGDQGAVQEKLVMGLDDTFAPMGFRDDNGNLVGFDIDLAEKVAERLGTEVEFKPIEWASKEVELNTNKIDMIWNALTITEERKKEILFTEPYMSNRQVIVVAADSDIQTKADLAGKVVGTQEGSSSIDAMKAEEEIFNTFKDDLKTYPDYVAALNDLSVGRLDAMVGDEVVSRYYMSKKPGEYRVLDEDFGDEDYGVGFRLSDTELRDQVQEALDELKAEGVFTELSEKWFGEDIFQ